MNKLMFSGRITKNGLTIKEKVSYMKVNESYKNKAGEWQHNTLSFTIFPARVSPKFLEYFKEGDAVEVLANVKQVREKKGDDFFTKTDFIVENLERCPRNKQVDEKAPEAPSAGDIPF